LENVEATYERSGDHAVVVGDHMYGDAPIEELISRIKMLTVRRLSRQRRYPDP